MPKPTLASRIHLALFCLALILWTVALLLPVPNVSANKALADPLWAFLFSKSLHVCAYLLLAVLGGTAFRFHKRWVWIMPILVAHGAAAEFFQQFVDRTPSVRDVLLDALGALVGGCIVMWWAKIKNRRRDLTGVSNPESNCLREIFPQHRLPIAASSATKTADNP